MCEALDFIKKNFDVEEIEDNIVESITKFLTPEIRKWK